MKPPAVSLLILALGLLLGLGGERVFGEGHALRLPMDAGGGLLLLLGAAMRARAWMAATGDARVVLGRLLPAWLGVLLAAALFGVSVSGKPLDLEGDSAALLQIAVLLLALASLFPLVLMELSLLGMSGAERLESRRVMESGRAGLALGLALLFCGFANYWANEDDQRWDLRTVKDVEPSSQTQEMVRNLAQDVTITLFFPPANEVAETIEPYFAGLDALSERLTVQRLDRDMHPKKAKEMRARSNGVVVVSKGTNHESVQLDVDTEKARKKLKKLDGEFQEKLAKIAQDQKVAYFTIGHGERSTSPRAEDLPGLKLLKDLLKANNYKVKNLGLNDGLGNEVPDDATVVFVVGPKAPLLDAERDSLQRYVQGGGSLFLLFDPPVAGEMEPITQAAAEAASPGGLPAEAEEDAAGEAGETAADGGATAGASAAASATAPGAFGQLVSDPLLDALGVTVSLAPLAHDSKYVSYRKKKSDRSFLASNRFTTHDSTTILSKNSSKMLVLAETAGSIDKKEGIPDKAAGGPDVQFTIRSLSGTWADLDGDLEFDKDSEKKKVFQMVAAVQLPVPEGDSENKTGGRAIVTADADLLTDFVLGASLGNQQWLTDALRWLEDEVALQAEVAEIEDVKILHTTEQDRLWFYGTTVGVPLLVLGLGAGSGLVRRRRAKR
jgi:hypothetical protein